MKTHFKINKWKERLSQSDGKVGKVYCILEIKELCKHFFLDDYLFQREDKATNDPKCIDGRLSDNIIKSNSSFCVCVVLNTLLLKISLLFSLIRRKIQLGISA